jgi:outer membrane protein
MKSFKRICFLVVFVLLQTLSFVAEAQQAAQYSLAQAVEYALKNNYSLINAQADVEIARKKILETTTIGLPQVNGEINLQNFINIPTQVIPENAFNPLGDPNELIPVQFGTNYNASAGVTATQLIFDGAYIVGLQASKIYAQLSKKQLGKTQNDVRAEVSQAYFSVVIAKANVAILKQSLENSERLLNETRQIFNEGFVEESDVDQLSLLVQNIRNSINRSERQLGLSYKLLKLQMGLDIDTPIEVSESLEEILQTVNAEAVFNQEFNPKNHVEFQLAETQQNLMKLNLKREQVTALPSIGAFVNHSENAFRNQFNFFDFNRPWYPTTVWGVNMRVPIFGSGMRYARVQQAKLEHEKAAVIAKFAEQSLKLQAQNTRADLLSAVDRLNNEKQNLVLAEKIQNRTLIKYQEGLATSFDLNQAQNQYLNTQGNYILTVFELMNAKSRYDKALNIN